MANEKRLIDANALIEEIERVYVDHYEKSAYKFIHDFFNAMRRRIRRAPTEQAVEVVHGRWESWGIFDDLAKCYVCGAGSFTMHFVHYHNFKHCPNCGAKMNGERENEKVQD